MTAKDLQANLDRLLYGIGVKDPIIRMAGEEQILRLVGDYIAELIPRVGPSGKALDVPGEDAAPVSR